MADDGPNAGNRSIFSDNSGNRYKFEKPDDIEMFVVSERAFWGEITQVIKGEALRQSFIDYLKEGLDILENDHPFHSLLGGGERSPEAYWKVLDEYGSGLRPTRTSTLAINLEDVQQTANVAAASTETRQLVGTFLITINAPEVSSLTISANDAVRDLRSATADAKAIQAAAPNIVTNLNEAKSAADKAKTTLETQLAEADEWHEDLQKTVDEACKVAAEDARKSTVESVHTALELKEPQEYWSVRRDAHQTDRQWSLGFFVGLCVVAMVGIPLYASKVLEWEQVQPDALMLSFAVLVVPGLIGVWLIRIASKSHATHRTLEVDAAEREVMTKAYLALNANERLTEDDKHLILKAIFRPSMQQGEEEPMPSWIDAVFSRIGAQSK